MFIYNIKLDKKKFSKLFYITISLIIIILLCFVVFKVYQNSNASKNDLLLPNQSNGISEISSDNYTNVLQSVHDNIDQYVGQKIKFTGFVYRVFDFTENQFVLARNMVINDQYQTVVVGFLCEHKEAENYDVGSWVEIEGEIIKGDYHGDMPIIKIKKMKQVNEPNEEEQFVLPPSEHYIPTSTIY